jgi:hypothetical protein
VNNATHDENYTDLVFVSHEHFIVDVNVDIPFATSDHASINFNMLSNVNNAAARNSSMSLNGIPSPDKLDFDKIDHAGLSSELLHTNWSLVFVNNDNIDHAWEKFNSYIMSLILRFTPKKTKSKFTCRPNLSSYQNFPNDKYFIT